MKRKNKRLAFVVAGLSLVAAAVVLVLFAFEQNIVFFRSPTDILAKAPAPDRRLRIGGLVEEGSVDKSGGVVVKFRVTDVVSAVPVIYKGILPDLFREGQGVVAEGYMKDGIFHADEVLAKHDENYMPPEAADALKKSGRWDEVTQTIKKEVDQQ